MDFIAERAPAAVRRAMGKRGGGASEDEGEVRRRTELVLAMAGVWGDYVGAETARQSLRFLWLEECLDGENPFCAGTFSRVLDAVSRPAREGAEIKLGCKVVKMVSDEGGGKVTARTEKGEEFSFDELVVTAPLGWLKRNLDSFEPRMPARFEEAVSALGYGSLDKVPPPEQRSS
jgi:phytoene dehydrogenase-like protein